MLEILIYVPLVCSRCHLLIKEQAKAYLLDFKHPSYLNLPTMVAYSKLVVYFKLVVYLILVVYAEQMVLLICLVS